VFLIAGAGCRKTPAGTGNATGSGSTQPAATPQTPAPDSKAVPQPATASPSAAAAPPVAAPPPAAPVPEKLPEVLARVNNEEVKKVDFDRLLTDIVLNNGPVPPDRRDEIMRRILDELVTYTVLKQEAAARHVEVTDAEVDQQVEVLRQQSGSEENFKKALAARKLTLAKLKSDARIQVAIGKMVNAQVQTATAATDAEAKAFYDQNLDKFKRDEEVKASHILILVDASADDAAKAAAKAKMEQVLKRAKGGEDFAALARENSQDGSAAQGGDLGYFPRAKMVKPFADAAFALKPGEISDIVTTQFGLHIIKTTDKKPASTVPLEEASPKVKEFLTGQKKQQQAQAFIAGLRQKAKIEVLI
jgi:peptidyl-prolyl cis-trans isomerase C